MKKRKLTLLLLFFLMTALLPLPAAAAQEDGDVIVMTVGESRTLHSSFLPDSASCLTQESRPKAAAVDATDASDVLTLNFSSYPLVRTSNSVAALVPTVKEGYSGNISWSVEDPAIAALRSGSSNTGAVFESKNTGVTNAVATLKANDGHTYTAKCQLVVIDPYASTTPLYVELNTSELKLSKGQTSKLQEFIYPENILTDSTLKNTLDTGVTYSSSNTKVATVDENGNVKAVGTAGQRAVITVTTKVSGRTDTCQVEIVDGSSSSAPEIQWTSSNPFIACVDQNGTVKAQSRSSSLFEKGSPREDIRSDPDKQTVEIYATNVCGGQTETFTVKVEPGNVQPVSVNVNKSKLNLPLGTTGSVTAVVGPASILNNGGDYVTWSTSDAGVVSVVSSKANLFGADQVQLRAVSVGTAAITATTSNGLTDSCVVTVTNGTVKVDRIGLEQTRTIDIDQACQLETDITAAATDQTLNWLISDRTVATVDREGNVMGYGEGSATVYAVAADSLTEEQKETLTQLGELRQITGENLSRLQTVLNAGNVVYETCALTVHSDSPYLRNLHAPAEAVTSESVNLLWNRDSLYRAEEFDHYVVYVNGNKETETEKLGYTVKGLNASTAYTFTVEAYTKGSNTAQYSESVTVTTKAAGRILNVLDYGAAGDGRTLDTFAIQKAINEAKPGDTVLLPKGYIFYSGALFLKSDMTFRVDGLLLGSTDSKDYPLIVTRFECWRKIDDDHWDNSYNGSVNQYAHASLLTAGVYDEGDWGRTGPYHLHNLVICGDGQINGNGFSLTNHEGSVGKGTTTKMDGSVRGRLISVHNGDGVYLEGVTLAFGPSWTTHIIFSKNVTIDNVKAISTNGEELLNGDGLDPDSTTYMNVFDSFFINGDDCVAIKSGRGQEGVDVDRPSAYIRITDCRSGLASTAAAQRSKGGFSIGSEEGGGVHDILFQNLYLDGAADSHGLWIKAYACRSGLVEDVTYRDCTVNNLIPKTSKYALYIQINKGVQEDSAGNANLANQLARVRRLTYENVQIDYQMLIDGQPATAIADFGEQKGPSYVEDVVFRGLKIVPHAVSGESWWRPSSNGVPKIDISYGRNIVFEDCTYLGKPVSFTSLDNTENILVDNKSLAANIPDLKVETTLADNNAGVITHGTGTVTVTSREAMSKLLDADTFTCADGVSLSVLRADGTPATKDDLNANNTGLVIRLTNQAPSEAAVFDYRVVPDYEEESGELRNVALNKTAAGATENNNVAEKGPQFAVDGNENTEWKSGDIREPGHELVIDLEETCSLTQFKINTDSQKKNRTYTYEVFVSDDGQNWGAPVGTATTSATDLYSVIDFETPVKGRYVMFNVTGCSNAATATCTVREIWIYGR